MGLPILRPFVWNYQRRTRAECVAIARWDREHNQGRVIRPWRRFEHPQLGPVEIGGFDPRFGIWNPPPERLAEVCAQQARVFLRLASLAPRVRIVRPEVEPLGRDLFRVRAVIENVGYLPTYVLSSAKGLPWNEPLCARIEVGPGQARVGGDETIVVGHLEGWGGFDKPFTPALARSAADEVRRRVEWVVRGVGKVQIHAEGPRVGEVVATLEVG